MGKFANTAAECGEPAVPWLGDGRMPVKEPWHGESGFDALGKQVPGFRKSATNEHLKQMGFTDAEKRYDIVTTMANDIARDDPHMALEHAMQNGVDATGCYRILSVMLAAEEPQP